MNVKRLSQTAQLPTRAYDESAGLDLYASEPAIVVPGYVTMIKTGISIELPKGTVGLIWPRSGLSKRGVQVLAGVLDQDFRGEVQIMLTGSSSTVEIQAGDRIAQLLIQPVIKVDPVEASELSDTTRADGGFGSSGR